MACHTCDPACANMLNWEGLGHCALQCSVRNRHRHKKHSDEHTRSQTPWCEKVSLRWCASMSTFSFRKTSHMMLWLTESQTPVFFFSSKSSLENSEAHRGKFLVHCCKFPVSWGTGVSSCPDSSVLQLQRCADVGVGVAIFDAPVRAPHSCMFDAPSTHRQ